MLKQKNGTCCIQEKPIYQTKKKQNRIEMPTPVEVRTRKIRYSVCKS